MTHLALLVGRILLLFVQCFLQGGELHVGFLHFLVEKVLLGVVVGVGCVDFHIEFYHIHRVLRFHRHDEYHVSIRLFKALQMLGITVWILFREHFL